MNRSPRWHIPEIVEALIVESFWQRAEACWLHSECGISLPKPARNQRGGVSPEGTEEVETPICRLRLDRQNGNLVGLAWKDPVQEVIQEPRLGENFRILLPRPGYEANYFVSSEQQVSRIEKTDQGVTCVYEALRNARETLNVQRSLSHPGGGQESGVCHRGGQSHGPAPGGGFLWHRGRPTGSRQSPGYRVAGAGLELRISPRQYSRIFVPAGTAGEIWAFATMRRVSPIQVKCKWGGWSSSIARPIWDSIMRTTILNRG